MKQLFTAMLALLAISVASYAAEKRGASELSTEPQPLAQKLANQQMTKGLTNETSSGVQGLNYQGGVAGYAGPIRPSDVASSRVRNSIPNKNATQPGVTQKAAEDRRKADVEQQEALARQRAIQKHEAILQSQVQQPQTPLRPHQSFRDIYGEQTTAASLVLACAAKGLSVDYVTGTCVSPQGRETNPYNLSLPLAMPSPKPQPSELVLRCGAQGRAADFVTRRCL